MLSVSAVHPSLLALAVVAVAVGPLDDAGGAVADLPVSVPVIGLGPGHVHHAGEEEHQRQAAQEEQAGGRGGGALHGCGWFLARCGVE